MITEKLGLTFFWTKFAELVHRVTVTGAASGLALVHRRGAGGAVPHSRPHGTRSKMRAARLKIYFEKLFIDVVSLAQIFVPIGLQKV